MPEPELVPLELDHLVQRVALEDLQLVGVRTQAEEADRIVLEFLVALCVVADVLADERQQDDRVLDLVDLITGDVLLHAIFTLVDVFELLLLEHALVLAAQDVDGIIVGAEDLGVVGVGARPLVVVEVVAEDLAVEERLDFDSLVDDVGQVLEEEVATGEVVLVLHYVLNNLTNSLDLVVPEGVVDGRPVEILLVLDWPLLDFVLVEDGVPLVEVLLELVVE
mmetsp:Transcript_797/g.995  ORF Transcript_797/g.995 Transcript_797/m.995 type:complete len:222 (-) Transcript_797:509-1174(-)